ncbi:MAG TPA: hypothetical protein VH619_02385 [Verrucomicrobiae bacterium]|jgi:hypothetical protein|nr:hypothetical protein [Verrucomicrobiae bacterium]
MGKASRKEARRRYRQYVEEAVRQGLEKSPWENLKEGLVLGSQKFWVSLQGAGGAKGGEPGVARSRVWRPSWEQTVEAVEETCGERWAKFCDRHRDTGRDLALFLARSRGRLTLRKLAQRAGMKSEAAVNLVTPHREKL